MAKKTVKRKSAPAKKKSKAKPTKKNVAKKKPAAKKKPVAKKKVAPKKSAVKKKSADKKKSAPKKKAAAKKKVAAKKTVRLKTPKKKTQPKEKETTPKTKKAVKKEKEMDDNVELIEKVPASKTGKKKRGRAKKSKSEDFDGGDDMELEDVDFSDVDGDDDDDEVVSAPPPKKAGRKKAEKEKKIIKAPIIIPNQRLGEKDITLSKKKEPEGKFELEFVVRSSPSILFELLSTPSGLSEWFADDVNIRDDVFTFFWDGSEQAARVIGLRDTQYIRFQWLDRDDGSFFEFKIQIDDLTNDVSLIITDFADSDAERLSSGLLWESQVNKMLHVLGSYF